MLSLMIGPQQYSHDFIFPTLQQFTNFSSMPIEEKLGSEQLTRQYICIRASHSCVNKVCDFNIEPDEIHLFGEKKSIACVPSENLSIFFLG